MGRPGPARRVDRTKTETVKSTTWRKLLMIDGGGWWGDNTSVLLFDMIKAGSLPPAEPGAYEHIA